MAQKQTQDKATDGLIMVCQAILTRWNLEIAERGEDAVFPARALRNDLADSIAAVQNTTA